MTTIWLIAFLGLLLVEFLTVGLVSIWFAFGALAALITTFITESVLVQVLVFVVISIIALLVTRPLMKKFKVNGFEPTNTDRVIGKVAEVTKEIKPNVYGEVVIFGTEWMAASEEKIAVGEKVVVEKIEGAKLIVRREGEE
ncbi:MAG: NfeD family protein [Mycoplasmatota bacterium]|nr:NfeD family protein [Mycoplasmatota bacterium]